ncbi:MAG TPA: DnaJ domain-containing protein [Polyangiaceae bacterium]|nr:DnaJ domain-containing protein [Polyangiaceae bacterium]
MVDSKSPPASLAAEESDAPATISRPRSREEQRSWLPPSAIASLVMQRHARLGHLNHFEVLDVPEHAGREAIRRAFEHAVWRFHPDQLVGEYERLQPLAKEIVCRIGTAYHVLENDESRAQYRRSLAEYPHLAAVRSNLPGPLRGHPALRHSSVPSPRPSSPELRASGVVALRASVPTLRPSSARLPVSPSSAVIDMAGPWTAEKAFAAAKIHLRRGALEEALAHIEQACIAEPEHAQYRALHAWLRVERGELTDGPIAEEILMTLTWAVRQRRNDLEIRMYRGRVLQRLGRNDEAIREFSVVASMDPTNREAVREVRLHQAREDHKAALAAGLWMPMPKES